MNLPRKASQMVLALSLVACGASETPSASTEPSEPEPTVETAERPAHAVSPSGDLLTADGVPEVLPTGTAPYEVHEWGVIDVQEDGRAEIAAGAGRPLRPSPGTSGGALASPPTGGGTGSGGPPHPMPVRKPVLYFHLDPGAGPFAITASARLVAGSIYETYPADSRPSPDTAAWAATLTDGPCRTLPDGDPSARDARRPPPRCSTPDGICEVRELPRYDASTASCVEVDGTRAGMLFYRGSSSAHLPLTVTRGADLVVNVTNHAIREAPGALLRVSTNLSGPWPVGHVVISRVAVPAVGSSVSLPVGTIAVDRAATRAELDGALTSLGLDEAERNAFLGEWMTPFFGPEPGASGRASEGSPPVPQDAVIYFLPDAIVSDVAVLDFSPAPRRVRRAFMVRVIFPAHPTA